MDNILIPWSETLVVTPSKTAQVIPTKTTEG